MDTHQHLLGEGQWRLGQPAVVHERHCSRPIAMAVEQRADDAPSDDTREGLQPIMGLFKESVPMAVS